MVKLYLAPLFAAFSLGSLRSPSIDLDALYGDNYSQKLLSIHSEVENSVLVNFFSSDETHTQKLKKKKTVLFCGK
jgi:hypothetical protein